MLLDFDRDVRGLFEMTASACAAVPVTADPDEGSPRVRR
jgi:hypothetical protein